ncbi:MAG TPA: MMPL family transporter [Candidatus Limnocylindria bacterium]|nr:MMPL family transporter [Candidatus Limnocylindria bacterium]
MNVASRPVASPWTVRVSMWSARHRWPVIVAWFIATIGLFAVSLSMGGTRAQSAVSTDTRAKYEAAKAYDVFNAGGARDPAQSLYLIVSAPSSTVDDPAFAAAVARMVGQLTAVKSVVDGQQVPTFETVVDPLKAPPASELVSPDRTTARIVARIKGEGASLEAKVKPIPAVVDQIRAENPGLEIYTLNNTLANKEISEVINSDLDGSLRLTIPLTFIILLVAFGALVAAAVPLVLAICSLLAAFGLLGIYSQVVTPVSPYASQLIVLIGLAVAVDYSLFMVTRFRSERHRRGYDSHRFYSPSVYLRRIALTAVGGGAIAAAILTGSPIASTAAIVIVLCLVAWSTWRLMERGGQRDKMQAIQIASGTAGRAVFFSGLAVMISIAGLLLLDDPLFRSMAIGTIGVVFISVAGSLTFLPATLAILGNGVNAGQVAIPFQALGLGPIVRLLDRNRDEGSGMWSSLTRRVMARPVVSAGLVAILLLAVASPFLRLHIGATDLDSFPDRIEAVKAANLMRAKWPQGSTLPLTAIVTRADDPATKVAVDQFSAEVMKIDGVSGPVTNDLSRDGKVAAVGFTLAGTLNDYRNWDIVREVRSRVVPAAFPPDSGIQAYITGDAAYSLDQTDFYRKSLPQVFAFVLSLSFLLLLIAFRSIVIPIKAIILNLLSTGAAYGLLVLVFQEGWLKDQMGIKPGVIEAFIPLFIFTILFGLSMDYHVFILTRIKEARDRGLNSNAAVARGISITSGTITSAAAIMVVVFGVFVTLQIAVIRQLGFGLAVAVFLDATIVRSILLPATMRLLGEWNWWLPRFLGWLPRVTIEAGEEEPEPGEPEPGDHGEPGLAGA